MATFGGTKSQPTTFTLTPTPSETTFVFVFTPVGTFSVFGFKTPIPYPFGMERTGYLVTDMDFAVRSAKAHDADIVVAPFPDPIGRDVIIAWPGGVHMQLYWHTTAPNYAKLQAVPENRVYVSIDRADAFVRDFLAFSRGKIVSDDGHAPGVEIGRPNDTYRRVRIESGFGKVTVLATDGHLPYPYGREITGYEVRIFPIPSPRRRRRASQSWSIHTLRMDARRRWSLSRGVCRRDPFFDQQIDRYVMRIYGTPSGTSEF